MIFVIFRTISSLYKNIGQGREVVGLQIEHGSHYLQAFCYLTRVAKLFMGFHEAAAQ